MEVLLAYILVIVLVQFCLTLGVLIIGIPIALCLSWLPASIRAPTNGTLAGIAGVGTAITFGYFVFHFVVGPGSFGIGAFLASTVPLVIPILKDHKHARQLSAAELELPEGAQTIAAPTTDAARYSVVGYILGLVIATIWFFLLHGFSYTGMERDEESGLSYHKAMKDSGSVNQRKMDQGEQDADEHAEHMNK